MKIVLGTMTFSDQVDQATASEMVKLFRSRRFHELDTAYVYNKGETENLLGQLSGNGILEGCAVAGKANPAVGGGLTAASVTEQLTTSLKRLNLGSLDLFYLHSPDLTTPISETLACVNDHYQAGRFRRFGLSNYAAWQVAEIVELCRRNSWVEPTVYQGMYNALTRDVERELFSCLSNYNISFYVYNPLAGGMLSGKHQAVDSLPDSGRFASFPGYADRYWKPDMFTVMQAFVDTCQKHDIAPAAAALRWLIHHSALSNGVWSGDSLAGNSTGATDKSSSKNAHAVIIGASSLTHLQQNLDACAAAELPDEIVQALDEGWEQIRPVCIKYFRP